MATFPDTSYLRWARQFIDPARINLAASGIPRMPPGLIEFDWSRVDAASWAAEIVASLTEAIALRYRVAESKVMITHGTSHANFIAGLALHDPDRRVAVEHPHYQPLLALASYLDGEPILLHRDEQAGWSLPPEEVKAALEAGADLIILSSPHNPTGHTFSPEELEELGELCARFDAYLLLDEVYLEFDFAHFMGSQALAHPRIVATASLTKFAGLAAIRTGWAIGPEAKIAEMKRALDLTTGNLNYLGMQVARQAFDHLDQLLAYAAEVSSPEKRRLVSDLVDESPYLSWQEPRLGLVGFMRLSHPELSADELAEELVRRSGVVVVPGRFFGSPEHLRISWVAPPEELRAGLTELRNFLSRAARA